MKNLHLILLLLLTLCCAVRGTEHLVADTPEKLSRWNGAKQAVFLPDGGPEQRPAIQMTSTSPEKSVLCELPLDLKQYAGKLLRFSADIRLEKIQPPAKPYYGLKLMFILTRADGSRHWAEDLKPAERFGTRNWEEYEAYLKIPADARGAVLSFGIQQAAGRADFANLKLEVIE